MPLVGGLGRGRSKVWGQKTLPAQRKHGIVSRSDQENAGKLYLPSWQERRCHPAISNSLAAFFLCRRWLSGHSVWGKFQCSWQRHDIWGGLLRAKTGPSFPSWHRLVLKGLWTWASSWQVQQGECPLYTVSNKPDLLPPGVLNAWRSVNGHFMLTDWLDTSQPVLYL